MRKVIITTRKTGGMHLPRKGSLPASISRCTEPIPFAFRALQPKIRLIASLPAKGGGASGDGGSGGILNFALAISHLLIHSYAGSFSQLR